MPRRPPRLLFAVFAVCVACGITHAVTGIVNDADGAPVNEARVCYFQYGVEQICALTDEDGAFELPDNDAMPIRITADGHHVETRPAVGHHEVVLRESATLVVRLVDAGTGDPIEKGELRVVYSAEKQVGPFPTNAAGVMIQRVLKPGEVRLVGKSEGYRDGELPAVTLANGKKTEVDIELVKLPAKDRP